MFGLQCILVTFLHLFDDFNTSWNLAAFDTPFKFWLYTFLLGFITTFRRLWSKVKVTSPAFYKYVSDWQFTSILLSVFSILFFSTRSKSLYPNIHYIHTYIIIYWTHSIKSKSQAWYVEQNLSWTGLIPCWSWSLGFNNPRRSIFRPGSARLLFVLSWRH
jgi:hypothetical protein